LTPEFAFFPSAQVTTKGVTSRCAGFCSAVWSSRRRS
jgi:hypothetical protein